MALRKKIHPTYEPSISELKEKFKEAIISNESIVLYEDYKRLSEYNSNIIDPTLIKSKLGGYSKLIKETKLTSLISKRRKTNYKKIIIFSDTKDSYNTCLVRKYKIHKLSEQLALESIQKIFGKDMRFFSFGHFMDERKIYLYQLPARKTLIQLFKDVETLNKKLDEMSEKINN